MQLYVDRKREKSEALMRKIEDLGHLKAIFVTVDAAAPGKREADERGKAQIDVVSLTCISLSDVKRVEDRLFHTRPLVYRAARSSLTVKVVVLVVLLAASSTLS
jgi:isopentenyl diphosphate isomerase/L-lactate dehydrogenase-like FMN-dependent dehydrogenase